MIKVLIVDDSETARELLYHIISSDPELTVVGMASNGLEGIKMAVMFKPDIITMDINMPVMDGIKATRKIMETAPVPIIIISAYCNPDDIKTTFQAMEAGAISVLGKQGTHHTDYSKIKKNIIDTIKTLSKVRVIRRWPKTDQTPAAEEKEPTEECKKILQIIAIGASTGGPPVIQTILSGLSKKLSLPVLIVQHITAGFIEGMTEWLTTSTGLPIHIAVQGEELLSGHVYFAPDDFHMGITKNNQILLNKSDREHGLRPSVSWLFRSVADTYGPDAIGILLTGMGKDGAKELKIMKDKGAVTIAQNKETSIVHSMPGEAITLGGACYILSPEEIVEKIKSIL